MVEIIWISLNLVVKDANLVLAILIIVMYVLILLLETNLPHVYAKMDIMITMVLRFNVKNVLCTVKNGNFKIHFYKRKNISFKII